VSLCTPKAAWKEGSATFHLRRGVLIRGGVLQRRASTSTGDNEPRLELAARPRLRGSRTAHRRPPRQSPTARRSRHLRLPDRPLHRLLERQDRPWFAHLSYLRPASSLRPPRAMGPRLLIPTKSTMPVAAGPPPIAFTKPPFGWPRSRAPDRRGCDRKMRAQYYGDGSGDVDAQLGRVGTAGSGSAMDDTFMSPDLRSRRAARGPWPQTKSAWF